MRIDVKIADHLIGIDCDGDYPELPPVKVMYKKKQQTQWKEYISTWITGMGIADIIRES